jgi:hypothetical protein
VRWTQWIFLQLFHKGLAAQSEVSVNWCPKLGESTTCRRLKTLAVLLSISAALTAHFFMSKKLLLVTL